MKKEIILKATLLTVLLVLTALSTFAQGKNSADDVAMELIGQVINPSPASSIQVGYLSYVNGLESQIFAGSPQNETSALLTFYSDTVTNRVINNGSIRTINRTGTFAIYLDAVPNGNFSDANTFRDGVPVLTANLRHQVIVDTVTASFTATFILTVVSADAFQIEGENVRLGRVGQKLRLTFIGHLNSPSPPAGYISGMIIGG